MFLASYVSDVELITPAGRVLTAKAGGNIGAGTTTHGRSECEIFNARAADRVTQRVAWASLRPTGGMPSDLNAVQSPSSFFSR